MNTFRARCAVPAGFSLVELLVSMVIALLVTFAITTVMIRTEGSKRSTTSVNDVNQTGSYVAYLLDRSIRSAGSGFAQGWRYAFGCRINAAKANAAILPMPTAFAAPFASVPQTIRVAPVLIGKSLADVGTTVRGDVLVVMGGTAGFGEMPESVLPGSVTNASMRLPNVVGYRAGDLMLIADAGVPAGCMLQQITAAAVDTLTFGGSYYKATGTNVNLTSFGGSTFSLQIGNALSNPPQFQLYGVGDNNTLFSHDLLQVTSTTPVPIADNVVEVRALYGLDTTVPPDGVLDTWVDAVANANPDLDYSLTALTDGSAAAQAKLRRIVAVRVGLILRTSLKETTAVSGPTIALFGDLGVDLQQTRAVTGSDSFYRFRTIEFTVPLRNVMFAPAT